jgi:predicted Kef-type K+ transport protein
MKSFRKLLKALLAVAAGAAASAPTSLLACAACTGRTDSSLAVGMNWGIVTLLGFVLSVLSCVVVFFVHVARRTPPEDGEVNLPGSVE